MSIAENLALVRSRIDQRARSVGRSAGEITLVAVAKTFPLAAVEEAARSGQVHFGENRVQEAEDKIGECSRTDLIWHLVGHLQSNKAKRAAQLFHWIHSVDSVDLMHKLENHAAASGREISTLLQLDLAGETSKSGMPESELDDALAAAAGLTSVSVEGLMILPPFFEDPGRVRPYFKRLRELLEYARRKAPGLPLKHLSMGMTHDFEIAIEEGATMVRIGTAIFGTRGIY
ncbi:MAG TPA: YggS family pyridoxal phosphate-dependent enzyme [Acidobacteriota bacterium]|jgi:hypothetical protein